MRADAWRPLSWNVAPTFYLRNKIVKSPDEAEVTRKAWGQLLLESRRKKAESELAKTLEDTERAEATDSESQKLLNGKHVYERGEVSLAGGKGQTAKDVAHA